MGQTWAVASRAQIFGSVTLVQGPETLLADRAVADCIARARQAEPEADVIRLDATDLDAGRFTETTGGSLFSNSQVVVVDEAQHLDPKLFDLVLDLAANPDPSVALVVVHPGGQKGKGLVDKLAKAKVPVIEAKAIKPWEFTKFVRSEANRAQIQLREDAIEALVQAVGPDARALVSALDQLAADMGSEAVTASTINRYFAGRAEVTSFSVADEVLAGRSGQALLRLRWALATGVAPVLVTSALANSFRALGKYLDLRSARLSEVEIARQISVPVFKVKHLSGQARVWGPRSVAWAMVAVEHADAAVKGAAHDAEFALEHLLIQLQEAREQRA